MTPNERMSIPRQSMPEQPPDIRKNNFEEVPYGYSPQTAITEAKRCLKCKKPLCIEGCPVMVQIPEFIQLIEDGDFAAAARKIKETNSLPAICGRVCPQETQCEIKCILGKKGSPVAIGRLERFCADYERINGLVQVPSLPPSTGKKIAVIGSGPAGLTVAGDLALKGHKVTIFEALHKPGGVLVYGIPEFRLPKVIVDAEVNYLEKLGVEVKVNYVIGLIKTINELFDEGYNAVFVGTGAGLPRFMNIPGENLNGVYSANEFLTRANLMKAYQFPSADTPIIRGKRVATVGGGNVAMDSARTALRLGAKESLIVYRRAREQMPGRDEEIHHAMDEGVQFNYLINPIEIIKNESGWVKSMKCLKMKLGEPDSSGRKQPVPIEGSEFLLDVDTVIMAIGNSPNPLIPNTTPDIKVTKWGTVIADEAEGKTSKIGVWAGGDIVTGAATVILAAGAGKKAASSIHKYLMGEGVQK